MSASNSHRVCLTVKYLLSQMWGKIYEPESCLMLINLGPPQNHFVCVGVSPRSSVMPQTSQPMLLCFSNSLTVITISLFQSSQHTSTRGFYLFVCCFSMNEHWLSQATFYVYKSFFCKMSFFNLFISLFIRKISVKIYINVQYRCTVHLHIDVLFSLYVTHAGKWVGMHVV